MRKKTRELEPLDEFIIRRFGQEDQVIQVHSATPSFRDTTKTNVLGDDGQLHMFDSDMSVEVLEPK